MLTLEHLSRLLEEHREDAACRVREYTIGHRHLAFNAHPSIMGVINLSADSWYRESVCLSADRAIQRGHVLHAQGADIVDVGAESSLAHAARVDDALQNSLLLPVVRTLSHAGVPVSVETYQVEVVRACLDAGAAVLNLTGTTNAGEMYSMVAAHEAAAILCYVQGPHVREVGDFQFHPDPIAPMYEFFARQVDQATRHGVEKIVIDPGLGFYYRNLQDSSLRVRYQMQVFVSTFRLRRLGFPVCHALPHAFEYFGEEVRCAEPFFALLALLGKTDLLRTHEVARVKAVLDTLRQFEPIPAPAPTIPPAAP